MSNLVQHSKLQLFWLPWRVGKIMATKIIKKVAKLVSIPPVKWFGFKKFLFEIYIQTK